MERIRLLVLGDYAQQLDERAQQLLNQLPDPKSVDALIAGLKTMEQQATSLVEENRALRAELRTVQGRLDELEERGLMMAGRKLLARFNQAS